MHSVARYVFINDKISVEYETYKMKYLKVQ